MSSKAILRTEVGEAHDAPRPLPHLRDRDSNALLAPDGDPSSDARDARPELLRQSGIARALGSAFVSEVLAAAWRQLDRAPRLAALIGSWPGDPAAAAMAMRLNAGLHALAHRKTVQELTELYAAHGEALDPNRFDRAVGMALAAGEDTILEWMDHPTQTNEVARSAFFMAALMTLAKQADMPFELLEIGASAGLNLMLDHYAHDLGGVAAGQLDSPVRTAPEWRGAPIDPAAAPVRIAKVAGVDLRPLRLQDPFTRERLLSYVWADDPARAERLCHAIRLNLACPPPVERESAAPWLARKLAEPQSEGTCRVIQHSMVLQYLPERERRAVLTTIMHAGALATPERPLAWIGLEWNSDRTEVQLRLTSWPRPGGEGGDSRVLAVCHAYGSWIDWRG